MMGEQIPGAGHGMYSNTAAPAARTAPGGTQHAPADKGGADDGFTLWDSDGFGFGDLLDVVNPLQHVPVISTIYRDLTGDDIGHAARVLGGGLFGGPMGAAASFANVIIDEATGDDLGGHALQLAKDITGIGEDQAAPKDDSVMVADASGSSPFDDGSAADGWTPDQRALANAVDEGDHLLVPRRVRPGTMNEPGAWEWVRVPKQAGPTPADADERSAAAMNAPAGAEPRAGDAPAPGGEAANPAPSAAAPDQREQFSAAPQPAAAAAQASQAAQPPAGAVAAVTAPRPTARPSTEAPAGQTPGAAQQPGAERAAATSGAAQDANADPMLAEAEAMFRLGLQYEPDSEWARVSAGGGGDDARDDKARDEASARPADPSAAPANPFDPAAMPAREPGGDWVANAMQKGLEKYRAMTAGTPAPGRPSVDMDL